MLHRKMCKTPGCHNLTYDKRGYCDVCMSQMRSSQYHGEKRLRGQSWDEKQEIENKGYRTSSWIKFSRQFLEKHPVCARCGAPATVTDHKVETARQMIDAYGHFILDETLYQPLCTRCNRLKAKEDKESDAAYFKLKQEVSRFEKDDNDIGLV